MNNKLPSQLNLHMNFYDESAKTATLEPMSAYEFLYERNKPYMNNTAITFVDKKITYEELHTRIDEYARALYKRGIRANDVVALGVANTPEGVYLEYALNKIGAITTPINLTYNSYKIARDLEIVNPKYYIGIRNNYRTIKEASKGMNIDIISYSPVQSFDSKMLHIMFNLQQLSKGNFALSPNQSLGYILRCAKKEEEPIYEQKDPMTTSDIMFTGGSSGIHKGVDLNSHGLNSVIRGLDYVLCLEPGEKFLGQLPYFMAFGKMALHYALCKSSNLELTLKAMPTDFVDELLRTRPQGVMGGPIHWETLINNSKLQKDSLSDLKMPITGGEQLKFEKEEQINEALYNAGCNSSIWNGLGMTEMWAPVSVKRGQINSDTTIGTMIPFTNAKIVNPNTNEELGFNQIGMLHVSGPGMMNGYYNNSEETDKSIYVDEFGTRWFITGDLCQILDNGELKYIGRLKRCFVSGCDNIYPEEIENLLCDIPEIREAIVTKIPHDNNQFMPKYHISLYDSCTDTKSLELKIEDMIKNTLGDSALPCAYAYYYELLPRTANAKIDPKPFQEKDNQEYEEQKRLIKKGGYGSGQR